MAGRRNGMRFGPGGGPLRACFRPATAAINVGPDRFLRKAESHVCPYSGHQICATLSGRGKAASVAGAPRECGPKLPEDSGRTSAALAVNRVGLTEMLDAHASEPKSIRREFLPQGTRPDDGACPSSRG